MYKGGANMQKQELIVSELGAASATATVVVDTSAALLAGSALSHALVGCAT